MVVKKVGKKWFPVGKKGNPWKTGFATEAKAKKALSKANAYWKSKGTGKKKTTKKKSTEKKTSKKRKATKKKETNKTGGGKRMKSRFSPVNKNGLKVVTSALLLLTVGSFFDKGKSVSAFDYAKKGKVGASLKRWYGTLINPSGIYKPLAIGTAVVAGGSRVLDMKSISFVQFS